MSETKIEKSTIIKLDEHQFQHLVAAIVGVSREVGVLVDKVGKLENRLVLIEGELKLIRIEIKELREKK